MKVIANSIIFSSLIFLLMSFSWTNDNPETIHASCKIVLNTAASADEVVITYDNSDVCGLKCLGEVKVTEKWWFYNNNDLKTETLAELKKQASEKGGNIVFVDINKKNGFGIFFSTTIIGYIYEK